MASVSKVRAAWPYLVKYDMTVAQRAWADALAGGTVVSPPLSTDYLLMPKVGLASKMMSGLVEEVLH